MEVDVDGAPVVLRSGEGDDGVRQDTRKTRGWSAPAFACGGVVELRPEDVLRQRAANLVVSCEQDPKKIRKWREDTRERMGVGGRGGDNLGGHKWRKRRRPRRSSGEEYLQPGGTGERGITGKWRREAWGLNRTKKGRGSSPLWPESGR